MFGFLRVCTILSLTSGLANGSDEFVEAFAKQDWERAEGLALAQAGPKQPSRLAAIKATQGDFKAANMLYEREREALSIEPEVSGRLMVAQAIVAFLNSRQYGDAAPQEALDLLVGAKDILGKEDLAIKMVEMEIMGYSSKAMHVQQAYLGYMQLLSSFQKSGDSLRVGHCAMRLGRVDGATGGHGGALQNFERAAHAFETLGDLPMQAWALRNVGHANRKMGHYEKAGAFLERALAEKTDIDVLQVRILNDLSRLSMETEKEEVAFGYEKKAHAVLALIQKKIVQGERGDSVILDFYHLLKLRYATLLPYETDVYTGFYDQLILDRE
jgi:tetratricopeptide (TPR) repeat protein